MKHPVDAHVGKRIRHRRWMVGITQQQLAEKVGVPMDRMEDLLAGEHEPRAGDIVRIERALNVSFEGSDFERAAS